jgi:hypothetical protein
LLVCHGKGFSDEKLKHNDVLEMDDDIGLDDTLVRRKQNHDFLSCFVTKSNETRQPFLELFWLQPNAYKRQRVLILTVTSNAVNVALTASAVIINALIIRKHWQLILDTFLKELPEAPSGEMR